MDTDKVVEILAVEISKLMLPDENCDKTKFKFSENHVKGVINCKAENFLVSVLINKRDNSEITAVFSPDYCMSSTYFGSFKCKSEKDLKGIALDLVKKWLSGE